MPSQLNIPEPQWKLGGRHSVARLWRLKPENYRLVGTECVDCGKRTFPRTPVVCPFCNSANVKDVELSQFAKINHGLFARPGTQGFEDQQPMIYATVETNDGAFIEGEIVNVTLPKRIYELKKQAGFGFYDLLKDKNVRMVVRKLRKGDNGALSYGFKFLLEETLQ